MLIVIITTVYSFYWASFIHSFYYFVFINQTQLELENKK